MMTLKTKPFVLPSKPRHEVRRRGRSRARQRGVRRRGGVRLDDRRDPHAGSTLHDRLDRGQQHGPRARPHRHLQRLLGTDGRREDSGRAAERNHEGHRSRR